MKKKKWDKWLHSFTNAVLNTSLQSDLVLLCFCPFLHGLFPSVHFWTGSFLLSVSEQALSFCLFLNGLFPSRLSHWYMLHQLKQEILSFLLGGSPLCLTFIWITELVSSWRAAWWLPGELWPWRYSRRRYRLSPSKYYGWSFCLTLEHPLLALRFIQPTCLALTLCPLPSLFPLRIFQWLSCHNSDFITW